MLTLCVAVCPSWLTVTVTEPLRDDVDVLASVLTVMVVPLRVA